MALKDKKVFITGVAGFIGSNLADKWLELGADVIGLDNMFNGSLGNLQNTLKYKNFRFVKGDLRDLSIILEFTKERDIIYHLGAFTSVPQSILMPETCNAVNVNGTINVLNAARKNEILPNENTVTIAQIIKSVFFKETAAPYTQHILMRFGSRADQTIKIFI